MHVISRPPYFFIYVKKGEIISGYRSFRAAQDDMLRLQQGLPIERPVLNHQLEINGELKDLKEWIGLLSVSGRALYKEAWKRGISLKEVVTEKIMALDKVASTEKPAND